jgi:hypothetical protein
MKDFQAVINNLNHRRNTMKSIATLALTLAGLSLTGQNTQAALATPSAIFTKTIIAGKTQYLGTPFVRPEVSVGEIVSVSGNLITVKPTGGDVTYTAAKYSGYTGASTANEPYIIEILDGDNIGYIGFITNSGATSGTPATAVITVDVAPGTVIPGARFAIRPDWTLESLFGPATSSVLRGTTRKTLGQSAADQIQLVGSNGRVAATAYRKWTSSVDATSQTGASFQWISSGVSGDARKLRLPYSSGIILKALAGSDYNLVLAGQLRQARLRKEILGFPRFNFVANTSAKDVPLSETGIQIARGSDVTTGDNLGILNVSTGATAQYYMDTAGNWRDADDNLANAVTIAKGTAVVIRRANGNTSGLTGASAVKINPAIVY